MDVRRRLPGVSCVFFLALLALVASSTAAHAADAVERVTSLNKKALDQVKKRDYDTARALLKEALQVAQDSTLDAHPIKARTHIHLGMVAIAGFQERDLAIKHFKKALEIQPDIKLTKTFATRDMQEAFDEAVAAMSGGGGGAPEADQGGGAPPQAGDEGGGAQAGNASADGDEEGERPKPRAKKAVKKKKKKSDDDEGEESAEEEEEDEGEAKYKVYVSLQLGSGFGVASGKGELDPGHMLQSAGFAPAQLGHLSPEVGYFFSPALMLSLRARLQYVSGLTGKVGSTAACGADAYCTPGTSSFAAFARATYFFGDGTSAFRVFAAGELGGGYIRHAQVFPGDTMCGMANARSQCVDSLKGGPFLIGGALGFLYDFSSVAGLVVNLVTDLGVSNFTINFDLNAGIAVHF